MSRKETVDNHIPIFGILLIFLGIVFLLQTLGVLPWGLWATLWRFWPVLIVVIGLGLLLKHHNPWLVGGLVMALLLACLGIAIWLYESPSPGRITTGYSEPLASLASGQVGIDFAAGNLYASSLGSSSPNFVEAVARNNGIKADFSRQDSQGRLRLSGERVDQPFPTGASWEVRLTRNIPLTMEVKSAAGNLNLDLSDLRVTDLQVSVDAGNGVVRMPSSTTVRASIKANVANAEIVIPDGVAARIKASVNLAAFEVNESRFPRRGDYYVSENFDSAQNRVDMTVDCNISRVRIR